MAVEDFSDYSKLDDNSRFTITSSKVSFADLTMGEDAYVYKDKTAGFFDGDFVHLLTVKMTAGSKQDARAYCWCLTNTVDDTRGIDEAEGSFLGVSLYRTATTYTLNLRECDSGILHGDGYIISLNTPYYLKIVRDESVGTHGTLYCYIYSDSARTTLLDTLSLTLGSSKKDFRYVFAVNTTNVSDASYTASGYSENLELVGGSSSGGTPTVTTGACTDVIAENATGNGYLVNLGTSAVTQHGHCWGTSTNPTTALTTKTTLGAAPNPTHFSSSITGLTPGTGYYVRAYATNTSGTAYGGNQTIAGDVTTIGRRHWWVEGKSFHYFDQWGDERVLDGHTIGGY